MALPSTVTRIAETPVPGQGHLWTLAQAAAYLGMTALELRGRVCLCEETHHFLEGALAKENGEPAWYFNRRSVMRRARLRAGDATMSGRL